MNFWRSLTSRLFRQVFGWYLILAIGVTAVQLGLEFAAVRRAIGHDLDALGQSFAPSVADALWTLDHAQLASMATGIVQTGFVTGAKVESVRGEDVVMAGAIPPPPEHTEDEHLLKAYQHRHFPLFQDTPRGERKQVGALLLFSDRSVVVERVKYSFIVILINSLIKTTGLWLILYLVIRRLLARPLTRLTEAVARPEFVDEISELVPMEGTPDDELGRLAGALRTMQERLAESRKMLENVNQSLEQMVAERTADLAASETKLRGLYELSPLGIALTDMQGRYLEFNEAFRRICGYSEEELKALDYWRLTPERYRDEEARQLESLERTGRYGPYEKEYRRKDGSLVPLRLNGVLVTGKDGRRYIWSIVEDITAAKEQERQLERAAHYDALTGIPNRALLTDRLRQAVAQSRRSGSLLAVCYLDLDGFKDINDAHGHEMGDQVLAEMAGRLHGVLRGGDTVARMGGDEFVLLLVGLGSVAECEAALSRILADMSRPVEVAGLVVTLSASIGVALCPADADDAGILLRHADMAMYQAKQAGKNRYRLFGR